MGKPNFEQFFRNARYQLAKHSPEILTGIGIAGMLTTTVLAVRATPKALAIIEQEKKERTDETIRKTEVIKLCWKCYIPSAVTGVMSVACLIGASSVNVKRNAALATAYTLSETALREYQEKVVEVIGEKKEQSVRDAIAKDKIERDPVSSKEVIITAKGNTLCYDMITKRYFKSDIDELKKIVNELNRRMLSENYISLNDFYGEIGLEGVEFGDRLGWNVARGFIELRFSSQLSDDGTPCLTVDHYVAPQYDYDKLM